MYKILCVDWSQLSNVAILHDKWNGFLKMMQNKKTWIFHEYFEKYKLLQLLCKGGARMGIQYYIDHIQKHKIKTKLTFQIQICCQNHVCLN